MKKRLKARNALSAIAKLRELVRDEATDEPVTQRQLSRIVGIPLDTIKSVESGRMSLSPRVQKNIRRFAGVVWDDKEERWISRSFIFRQGAITPELSPATAADIREYRKMMEQSAATGSDRDRDAVKMRVDALFDQIPARYWIHLLFRMQDSLEELREEFAKRFKNQEALDLAFTASANRSYLHDLGASALRKYRKRMAKLYGSQPKNVRPDGSITWPP